jgi:hypothetical protein
MDLSALNALTGLSAATSGRIDPPVRSVVMKKAQTVSRLGFFVSQVLPQRNQLAIRLGSPSARTGKNHSSTTSSSMITKNGNTP